MTMASLRRFFSSAAACSFLILSHYVVPHSCSKLARLGSAMLLWVDFTFYSGWVNMMQQTAEFSRDLDLISVAQVVPCLLQ